jgi:uroporphyrin-III C-methyltransferase/precorrin-2 dehydrogenase/sirohydrochlorin ferrochelatase
MMTDLFPIFLKLAGRPVLLVGGGLVAASKLAALKQAGAKVTVIAPRVAKVIAAARVRVLRRRFRASDLDGQWLVIARRPFREPTGGACGRASTGIRERGRRSGARQRLSWRVLRRAGVTLAVSTDGHAPALAGLLREGLEAVLPDNLDRWLATARRERRKWKARRVPMHERRPQLLHALNRLRREGGGKSARPGLSHSSARDQAIRNC